LPRLKLTGARPDDVTHLDERHRVAAGLLQRAAREPQDGREIICEVGA
jgi:hypothetical protein